MALRPDPDRSLESGIAATLDNWRFHPESGPRVVALGGGTGLSTLLRGLKRYTAHPVAVVTVADDGGGSGVLRRDLGILPPGDIRNCILALADIEPVMRDLILYRFPEGSLSGQSFGNLFIAAMNGISENFHDAVRKVSSVLAVKGKVLPVSLSSLHLEATLEDGSRILGESAIGHRPPGGSPVRTLSMVPPDAPPLEEVLDEIRQADLLVMGPGSLYTSVIPLLLFPALVSALQAAAAPKLYICNLMTQPGETEGYDAPAHVEALLRHAGRTAGPGRTGGFLDAVLVNAAPVPTERAAPYRAAGAEPVAPRMETLASMGVEVLSGDLLSPDPAAIRHDPDRLARLVLRRAALQDRVYVARHADRETGPAVPTEGTP